MGLAHGRHGLAELGQLSDTLGAVQALLLQREAARRRGGRAAELGAQLGEEGVSQIEVELAKAGGVAHRHAGLRRRAGVDGVVLRAQRPQPRLRAEQLLHGLAVKLGQLVQRRGGLGPRGKALAVGLLVGTIVEAQPLALRRGGAHALAQHPGRHGPGSRGRRGGVGHEDGAVDGVAVVIGLRSHPAGADRLRHIGGWRLTGGFTRSFEFSAHALQRGFALVQPVRVDRRTERQ